MQNLLKHLLRILIQNRTKGLPLLLVEQRLFDWLGSLSAEDSPSLIRDTIDYALDNWLIEKIPAYDLETSGKHIWFLRVLSKKESKRLRNLPKVEQVMLRLLQNCDGPTRLGGMTQESILKTLRTLGFDIDVVPYIPGRVEDALVIENGELVRWFYLIPQEELSEKHETDVDELVERIGDE